MGEGERGGGGACHPGSIWCPIHREKIHMSVKKTECP